MTFLLANKSIKYNRKIEDTYKEDKMSTKNVKASEIAEGGGERAGEDQTLGLEFEFESERVLLGVLGGGSERKNNMRTRNNISISNFFRRRKRRTFKIFEKRTSPSKKAPRKRKSEKWATSLSRLPTEEYNAILRLHGFIAPYDF